MGSTFGRHLRATTFGESHGPALGVVLDGVPAGLLLDLDGVAADLARRRPGQSSLTTPRDEADRPEVLSGLFEGRTTGAPLAFLVRNEDADPSAYEALRDVYRPSHADWTTTLRYGIRDWRGGGRASARETVGRVAAGAVARQLLAGAGVTVVGWVDAVGDIDATVDSSRVTRADVDAHPTRCPDPAAAEAMATCIRAVRAEGDTVGGIVGAVARGVPGGLGEPVADKLEAALAGAMLSLPASRGFEIGSGFRAARMRGSAHNDAMELRDGRVRTRTNHAGGVLGGMSTSEDIVLRVAFKPVATLRRAQDTVDVRGAPAVVEARGRHDPCVVPRAVPMVEAMFALVLADAWLGARLARVAWPT
jgi:chorismate synthase